MDSFPVSDGWFSDLQARISDRVPLSGIIERSVGKRNRWGEYVHPSCLLISKEHFGMLRNMSDGLRFGGLSPTRADCAEMLTVTAKRAGLELDGWRYTHSHFSEVAWGFRYYGGFWCHVWMLSQLVGQRRWHGESGENWIYGLYGVSRERFTELLNQFVVQMLPGESKTSIHALLSEKPLQ
jgi:hypothetical protein